MQQHATYDTYNPPEEAAEGRAEARSGSFGTTCIHMHEFPRCRSSPRRSPLQGGRPRRPWRADKADCSFIITNIVSGSSSWASTRRRRRRLRRGGSRQGTYYLKVSLSTPSRSIRRRHRRLGGGWHGTYYRVACSQQKVVFWLSPSRSACRHRHLSQRRRLDSRPLRGHSGWDGGLCACKHRMHRRTAMASSIRWSLIMTWSHFPLQISRNVDEGPASTAAAPGAGSCGQPAAGQSWQHVALERLSMLGLFPGRSSRGRRSSSEEEAAATLRAHADASVVVWLS